MWSIWRQEIIQIPYLYIDRTSMTHSNVKFVTKNSKWRKCEEHEGKKLLHEMRFLERERTSMTYSNANTFAASMSVICYLHLWMSSMDDIHGWHFHPWMKFPMFSFVMFLEEISIHHIFKLSFENMMHRIFTLKHDNRKRKINIGG